MALVETRHAETRGLGDLAHAILVGGFIAGLFDIIYACTIYGLRGVSPERILQSIASGLLGRAAYAGGASTALLGGVLHFAMTTIMAAIFVLASLRLPMLRTRAIPWGMAYGAAIFLIMNHVVVPLSAAYPGTLPPPDLYASGLAVHILFVGLPIALAARWGLGNRE